MSRSSPGVQRVAAILNFIADHPGQAFALTDLVRALKLSRATCHALLTGLVDVGYLYRTSDKTYVLGPALAAIGRTAADQFSPLKVAQPEMRTIADQYDVVCGAYFLEGDTMHLRERAASVSHVGYPVQLGTRMALRSALAPAFLSWSAREAETWLARRNPRPSPENTAIMHAAMDFTRQHRFLVLAWKSGNMRGQGSGSTVPPADTDELPITPLLDFAGQAEVALAAIMAPVFDERGNVGFALVMAGFTAALSGAEVMAAGEQLAAACQRISAFYASGSAD
jgi:DNA-binding IclR family transcriptional regulator